MENDAQETSTDINTVAGIFSVMRSAVGGNILGMAAIVVFYAAAFTAVNFVLGYPADRTAAVARTLVNLALTMSLVSVLRPAFERGKLKSAAIFPGFMFIIKMVFFIAFLTVVWFLLRLILYGFWSVAGYMILPVATQMFTRDNMYMIVAAAVFVNFAVTTYLAFCFISLSARDGFWESLGAALRIFAENKFFAFSAFALLSIAVTALFGVAFSRFGLGVISASAAKMSAFLAALLSGKLTPATAMVSAAFATLIPLYWIVAMSVYFTFGHDGTAEQQPAPARCPGAQYAQMYGQYQTGEASHGESQQPGEAPHGESPQTGEAPQTGEYQPNGEFLQVVKSPQWESHHGESPHWESQHEEAPQDGGLPEYSFVTEAIALSWGIYKLLFVKLTAAVVAVHAVFVLIAGGAFLALRRISLMPDIFAGKYPSFTASVIFASVLFLLYCLLMFCYLSFTHGFFSGKGLSFKNLFPPSKKVSGFFRFAVFMAAFAGAIPFILIKIHLLLAFILKDFRLSDASLMTAPLIVSVFTAAYVGVSFFYVPFIILDGRNLSDSLAVCNEMMSGYKTALFGILLILLLVNAAGYALGIVWLFTVPFSILVITQIYVTIASGYEDAGIG